MNQKEILEKIKEIKESIEKDQLNIIREKILEREFHLQKPRHNFLRKFIQKIRKRLIIEINHILHPILENQKEINLRLLKEIEQLKKIHFLNGLSNPKKEIETKSQKSLRKIQK